MTESDLVRFRSVAHLNREDALAAASLAYQAFEDFYALFGENRESLIQHIAAQFESLSELNQAVIAYHGTEVAGVCCFYDLKEFRFRQMSGLRILLEGQDEPKLTLARLAEYRSNFSEPGNTGVYVSRFSISEDFWGSGLALNLLMRAEEEFKSAKHSEIRLHVKRHNERAISFYRKCGYHSIEREDRGYLLLRKNL